MHVATLSYADNVTCEGLLDECFPALSGMARGKAPGCEDLPTEFFLKFWHVLSEDLVDTINFSFQSHHPSLTQRGGIISLSFRRMTSLTQKTGILSRYSMSTTRLLPEPLLAGSSKSSIMWSAPTRPAVCLVAL